MKIATAPLMLKTNSSAQVPHNKSKVNKMLRRKNIKYKFHKISIEKGCLKLCIYLKIQILIYQN